MFWETISKTKYILPDGSIFVKETTMDDWNRTDENVYFEINNSNWTVKEITVEHSDPLKSYKTYKFSNSSKTIKIDDCEIKKEGQK